MRDSEPLTRRAIGALLADLLGVPGDMLSRSLRVSNAKLRGAVGWFAEVSEFAGGVEVILIHGPAMKAEPLERLPRGQVLTKKWPVLTYGETPAFDPASWTFRCFGLVKQPLTWSWAEFLALPRVQVTSDVHCVTRWSRFDNRWEGVAVSEILRRAEVRPEAVAVMVHADPDYTTNLLLTDLQAEDALLALKHDGADLPREHGGPCRLVVPKLYFWKSAKWVRGFEILDHNQPGFWELNGYHLRADPWKEERYAAQETDAMQRMRAESARRRRSLQ